MGKVWQFKNLQVSDNDLIGNKFNGHDLHLYLRENDIDSKQLVFNKESNDKDTYIIGSDKVRRDVYRSIINEIKREYSLDNIIGVDSYDILYNKFFLDADVVHFHLLHNLNFDIQLLPYMTRLKPTVWTIHDPWALSGHCIHHFKCDRWQEGCGECPLLSVPFKMDHDNTALNFEIKKQAILNSKLDIIVASKWLENKIKISPIFKNAKIHRIPFGINQSLFTKIDKDTVRDSLGIPRDALVIMARCDYSGFKGFDFVEYALSKITSDRLIYLLIVGDSVKKAGRNYITKEFGWIKDDTMLVKLYNAADLFLMPSKVDTFGMMAIEAMSCGLLPIVLDGTSLNETVNSPECGVSVKRDINEYAKIVNFYANNDKIREKKAEECLKFARENYNKEIYISKIIKVYKSAINTHVIDKNYEFILKELKKNVQISMHNKLPKKNKAQKDNLFKRIIFKIKHVILSLIKKTPEFKALDRIETHGANTQKKLDNLEDIIKKLSDDPSKIE